MGPLVVGCLGGLGGRASRGGCLWALARRSETQRGPHVVDRDLPNRLYPSLGHEPSEDVPVQGGAELPALWVSNPRETILEGGVNHRLGDGVER